MILSRRLLFTLPASSVIPTTDKKMIKPPSPILDTPLNKITKSELPPTESIKNNTERTVVISDVNDVKFFNHCATLFELYHDEYKTVNQYKKDQYKKYKMSLIEAYDNSTTMIESEDLRDFLREQGATFSMENVCDIHECV